MCAQLCESGITVVVVWQGQIIKTGELPHKAKLHRANRTISLFADNDLGDAFILGILVVDLITVNKRDDVGILLDGA